MQGVKELDRCLAPLVKELCLECKKWAKVKAVANLLAIVNLPIMNHLRFI